MRKPRNLSAVLSTAPIPLGLAVGSYFLFDLAAGLGLFGGLLAGCAGVGLAAYAVIAGAAVVALACAPKERRIHVQATARRDLQRVISGAFVLADITAGTKVFTGVPANAIVTGFAIRVTTQLTFSNVGTTGVTVKAGTAGDDDGYFAAVQLSGAAGNRYAAAAGALVGCQVAGGSGSFTLTFAATGGAADLAHVSAGAGTIYLLCTMPYSS